MESIVTLRRCFTVGVVAVVAVGAGCRKKAEPRPDAGPPAETTVLVGPAVSQPFLPGAPADAPLRSCRVAMKSPEWGGAGMTGMRIRTFRARGSRAQVLEYARAELCRESGVPELQCTPDRFDPSLEGCDGDPPRPHRPLSPEEQALVDKLRAEADRQTGTPPTPPAPPPAGTPPTPAPPAPELQ